MMKSVLSGMSSKKDAVLSSSFSFEHPFLQRRRPPRPSHPYNAFFVDSTTSSRYSKPPQQYSQSIILRSKRWLGCLAIMVLILVPWPRFKSYWMGSDGQPTTVTGQSSQQHAASAPSSSSTSDTAISAASLIGAQFPQESSNKDTSATAANALAAPSTTSSPACDCYSSAPPLSASSSTCCQRLALRAHKMGVVLLRDYLSDVPSAIIHPKELPPLELSQDYRHVVLTRPLADAILSGYLYHKTGRECWLDQNGKPRQVNKTFDWTSHLQFPVAAVWALTDKGANANSNSSLAGTNATISGSTSLTLCEYLHTTADVENDEYHAMKTYMDWSLHDLYAGLVPYYRAVEQRNDNKTLFVCFDELSSPATQATTLQRMQAWLYPSNNGDNGVAARQEGATAADSPLSKADASYQGGHSTSKDPALRQRLLDLIATLDRDVFQGRVTQTTALFGCGGDKE